MKKIISLVLGLTLFYCATPEKKSDGFIYVTNITGINLDDAELNAKREIIAKGLGELVEGEQTLTKVNLWNRS
jgi:hypothetical protein